MNPPSKTSSFPQWQKYFEILYVCRSSSRLGNSRDEHHSPYEKSKTNELPAICKISYLYLVNTFFSTNNTNFHQVNTEISRKKRRLIIHPLLVKKNQSTCENSTNARTLITIDSVLSQDILESEGDGSVLNRGEKYRSKLCNRNRSLTNNDCDRYSIVCSLLRIFISICWITGTHCYFDEIQHNGITKRGIHDLQSAMRSELPIPFSGYCDFEVRCSSWNGTTGFRRIQAQPNLNSAYTPNTDASSNPEGSFLWMTGPNVGQIWSSPIPPTGSQCSLEFALYQIAMNDGNISLIINVDGVSSITKVQPGNNRASWETIKFALGAISQPYRLILEITPPYPNSSIGVDNIRLNNCFPESTPIGTTCTKDMFLCRNGSCLNKARICDLTADCSEGEDEQIHCDQIPKSARCNFESGWCGWSSVHTMPLNWTLHRGSTTTDRTGPSYDHTYRNETGTYAYVKMSVKKANYGHTAVLQSPLFNPTPPYSSDTNSSYYKSCQVRFFYHKYGANSAGLELNMVQVKPHHNQTELLWRTYGDRSDVWYNQVVPLPESKNRFFLAFEANRGLSPKGDTAIDDISLSPECFGLGVPLEILGDFNYSYPKMPMKPEPIPHPDFINVTVTRITTCQSIGRTGPNPQQCMQEHNLTKAELVMAPSKSGTPNVLNLEGVQRWTVKRGGYYTLIGSGARGGKGSSAIGSSLGALVRGVIELEKGQQLYFMIGQAGMDACPNNVKMKPSRCQLERYNETEKIDPTTKVRQVNKLQPTTGGGGGGGATCVFLLKENGEQQPILIAGGGGGLGPGVFVDDETQHGQGQAAPGEPPFSGITLSGKAGGGGGWNDSSNTFDRLASTGIPLTQGGIGGIGCGPENQNHGDGGFGGGGGGCLTGGGGGGFIGGNTGQREMGHGLGGYSYATPEIDHAQFGLANSQEPSEVLIIPVISGCGCDYRCAVLDHFLSEIQCLCPSGWRLGEDFKSCIITERSVDFQTFQNLLIMMSVVVLIASSALFALLYSRYQQRKDLLRRRQAMFGNGTELISLRAVSDNMMTEFNPNYEFAGNLYSFKDLPQIPRENISLIKPLGQGAFGEVFQGIYKYRRNEDHPVAVKTLPSLSTSQAEADFMMEALIMSKFNHPNIVHFIGVSFEKHPRYIILELLAGGDLKNFLREERPRPDQPTNLTMKDLVMCSYDVANGCKYMEDARFIHRDIAARNCLLTCKGPGRIVKIADFGMARDIYRSDYYRKGGKAMLPIKWMPPESFLDGIFTTKTDVWAFGILLWEIMSFGYMPYTGCANREVMSMVTTGGRLEKPSGCPDPIYGIMTRCWHPRPEERPSFTTIVERIGYCLQDPDVVNHPLPNYDILPLCEREITIMRPDPETECINVHSDLDAGGYMRPRIINRNDMTFQPTTYRIGWNMSAYGSNKKTSIDQSINQTPSDRPSDHYSCNDSVCDSSTDRFDDSCDGDDVQVEGDYENEKYRLNLTLTQDATHGINSNPGDNADRTDSIRLLDDDNNQTIIDEEVEEPNDKTQDNIADKKNANDSNTTTDTDPDPLVIHTLEAQQQNCDCTVNRGLETTFNINNANGIIQKSPLKATLSLDPSALYHHSSQPLYNFSPPSQQRSKNSTNVKSNKESLGQQLPREEECSC